MMPFENVLWPPVPDQRRLMLIGLLHQLDQTQYLPVDAIVSAQFAQLRALAGYHYGNNAWFKQRMDAAGLKPDDLTDHAQLRKLPVLHRYDIQRGGKELVNAKTPQSHGPTWTNKTSGSSGEPVVITKTALSSLFWAAHSMRDHRWNDRDTRSRLASIRADIKETMEVPSWGSPASELYVTGPALGMFNGLDIDIQLDKVRAFRPNILLIYPNNLDGFCEIWERDGYDLDCIEHIKTIGETVRPELRDRVKRITGLDIEDVYSSNECGTMAIQCPESGLYHEMSETVIVEIIREDGEPAQPGEEGRLVITDLHNFAMPIIRYQINDWAERGDACTCGRTLPVINRIIGREHSIMTRPDGSKHWPMFQGMRFAEIAPVRQYQVIQHTRDQVELKIFTEEPITEQQEQDLIKLVQGGLGWPYDMRITQYRHRLPLTANGKFQEFISKVK